MICEKNVFSSLHTIHYTVLHPSWSPETYSIDIDRSVAVKVKVKMKMKMKR